MDAVDHRDTRGPELYFPSLRKGGKERKQPRTKSTHGTKGWDASVAGELSSGEHIFRPRPVGSSQLAVLKLKLPWEAPKGL